MENKCLRIFTRAALRLIMNLMFRIRFKGAKDFPKEGGLIVCANHTSLFDIPILAFISKRWIHYMAKKELFEKWFGRKFVTAMGGFPVDRGRGDIGSIKTALRLLKSGKILGLFPQGTREKKGERLPARKGAAMLAALSGSPIVPVLIEGEYRLFGRVTVTVGKPYDLGLQKGGKYPAEVIEQKSMEIMDRIYALRGVYA
ncbi:MAG: lysophospholipid acyltransferase family protein [Clostridia bacterium]